MNYAVAGENRDIEDVAREFLRSHRLGLKGDAGSYECGTLRSFSSSSIISARVSTPLRIKHADGRGERFRALLASRLNQTRLRRIARDFLRRRGRRGAAAGF